MKLSKELLTLAAILSFVGGSFHAASASPSAEMTTCDQVVSEGDAAAGINIITDTGCSGPGAGAGCISGTVCRYCKEIDTEHSTQFEACSVLTGQTPAAAVVEPPITNGVCASSVSEGDRAAGIRAIDDTTCVHGGQGCFTDGCRYCKLVETPQSTAWVNCTTFDPSAMTAPIVHSDPGSELPITVNECSPLVSEGDSAAGIRAINDLRCIEWGIGCFTVRCRYCKLVSTPNSEHLMSCLSFEDVSATPAPTPAELDITINNCSPLVSQGDRSVGIRAVSDSTCVENGLGCFSDTCRYCKIVSTPSSEHLMSCSSFTPATSTPTSLNLDSVPVAIVAAASSTSDNAKLSAKIEDIFKNGSASTVVMVVAACVGLIAAIAVVVFTIKRAARRLDRTGSLDNIDLGSECDLEEDDDDERAAVTGDNETASDDPRGNTFVDIVL